MPKQKSIKPQMSDHEIGFLGCAADDRHLQHSCLWLGCCTSASLSDITPITDSTTTKATAATPPLTSSLIYAKCHPLWFHHHQKSTKPTEGITVNNANAEAKIQRIIRAFLLPFQRSTLSKLSETRQTLDVSFFLCSHKKKKVKIEERERLSFCFKY